MSQRAASSADGGPYAPAPGAGDATPEAEPPRLDGQVWINLVIASLLMVATLPGRTFGLGMITEPLLRDLSIDHLTYAHINLWATLGGAALCLPVGYLIDRIGLRTVSVALLVCLGLTVWLLSDATGGVPQLFVLILLTRAFGQSGLSVASITTASRAATTGYGMMMGIYSVVLTLFFASAFSAMKEVIPKVGWRAAWLDIAIALGFVIAPITLLFLRADRREPSSQPYALAPLAPATPPAPATGHTLMEALATPAFWVFGLAVSLYGLVASGLFLFAQAVLAERGFDATVFYSFYTYSSLASLVGQLLCGWLALRYPLSRLLTVALIGYAVSLGMLPWVATMPLFWIFTVLAGSAGGAIAVIFYAVWKPAFGTAQLGRIQGAAQFLTVLASAAGPLVFAECKEHAGSYAPVLLALALVVALLAAAAWRVRMPRPA
jgi:MFS family permease